MVIVMTASGMPGVLLLALVLCSFGFSVGTVVHDGWEMDTWWENRECTQAGVIALTFDDGTSEWTHEVLDAMQYIENKYDISGKWVWFPRWHQETRASLFIDIVDFHFSFISVPGTFFVNAERVSGIRGDRSGWEVARGALQRLVDTNQMIAHHGYTHVSYGLLDPLSSLAFNSVVPVSL